MRRRSIDRPGGAPLDLADGIPQGDVKVVVAEVAGNPSSTTGVPDHERLLSHSANGGGLIDFSSKQKTAQMQTMEATGGQTSTDGNDPDISDSLSSLPVSKERRGELLASDVRGDRAKVDGLDAVTPAAICGEKMAISLDYEEQPSEPSQTGHLDSVSAHGESSSTSCVKAADDIVSSGNLPSSGLPGHVSSTDQKEGSSGLPTSDVQNGAKGDEEKEPVAASDSPKTSVDDKLREMFHFYQSSPTFSLELDPSLAPEQRERLEMQLASSSLQSRIYT